ncbi:MAG TPA: cupin domain-containing protein [Candidatus Binataceae bacterium]|nr:cupin domain-containing protein [Candidatus Binataceae bacterium]
MAVRKLMPPAIDPASLPESKGVTSYPEPFRAMVAGRMRRVLGETLGLKNFGVNLSRLDPGAYSSARHWHSLEDEFVYVLEGEVTLITDEGEQTLTAGMAAGFPAGKPNGHHLVNRGSRIATYLEIGDRRPGDEVTYPDIDLELRWARRFRHKDGRPY